MKPAEDPIHTQNSKGARAFQATRRLVLILFFAAIAVAAHPVGPLKTAGDALWSVLSPFGLDVAMTPFTSDMMFVGLEREVPSLIVDDSVSREKLGLEQLGLYQVRIPLLLLAEMERQNVDVELYTQGICRSLERHIGRSIKSWARDDLKKEYLCAARGS